MLQRQSLSSCNACEQEPEASSEGLGGTYFFMNEAGRRAAIVKPCDEEPLAPNNPKVGTCVPHFGLSEKYNAIFDASAVKSGHDVGAELRAVCLPWSRALWAGLWETLA
jgi:hypothetical protein